MRVKRGNNKGKVQKMGMETGTGRQIMNHPEPPEKLTELPSMRKSRTIKLRLNPRSDQNQTLSHAELRNFPTLTMESCMDFPDNELPTWDLKIRVTDRKYNSEDILFQTYGL